MRWAGVAAALLAPGLALEPAPVRAGSFSLKPTTGPVGTVFSATGTGYKVCTKDWYVTWDSPPVESAHDWGVGTDVRTTSLKVPSGASPGVHKVYAWCDAGNGPLQAGGMAFTVTEPVPLATTTTVAPGPGPRITPIPPAPPTTSITPTTGTGPRPPTTTSSWPPFATTSTTTSSSPPRLTTTTSRIERPAAPPDDPPAGSVVPSGTEPVLLLDRPSTEPGGSALALGRGCAPGAPVLLSVEGRDVGTSAADADGAFAVPLAFPEMEVGNYQVEARCGPALTAPIDLAVASLVDPATSTLVVLIFFVLLGLAAFRRQLRQ